MAREFSGRPRPNRVAEKAKAFPRWRISLAGPPATFVGFVDAPTETAAIQWAGRKFKIAYPLKRLVAHREFEEQFATWSVAQTITVK